MTSLHNGAHAQWVFALTGGVNVTFPEAPGGFAVSAGGLFISTVSTIKLMLIPLLPVHGRDSVKVDLLMYILLGRAGQFYPWPSKYMGSWFDLHSSTFPRRSCHQPYRYCQPLMRRSLAVNRGI